MEVARATVVPEISVVVVRATVAPPTEIAAPPSVTEEVVVLQPIAVLEISALRKLTAAIPDVMEVVVQVVATDKERTSKSYTFLLQLEYNII